MLAFTCLINGVGWILLTLELFEKSYWTTVILHLMGVTALCSQWSYNFSTIAVFLQRIFFLCFPAKNTRRLNLILLTSNLSLCVSLTVVNFAMNIGLANFNVKTVAPGCYSFNCMSSQVRGLWILFAYTIISSSIAIVVLGSILQFLMRRYRTHFKSSVNVQINKFTSCLFYLRVVLEIFPFLVDAVLLKSAGISLGKYIGPFGALGASADVFFCTCIYYYMVRKSGKNRKTSHTASRNQ
ncbi:hypothetical protein L596_019759 [Steinernema carpocapsae]|uniref:G-protein coupled receptors family 1 profile domain-containing protein n=1 Tax=Steinernema carpocapsae TaxID=34508 RepID=A0A4U5MRH8_STECR|nr:hypothetical protein L596_019759 [Steinernema carpocapsae]